MPDDISPHSPSPKPYISNPFTLIWSGFKALTPNVGPLILIVLASVGLVFALVIPGIIVLLIAASNKSAVLAFLGAVLILAAMVMGIVIGVRLYAASFMLYLANTHGHAQTLGEFYHAGKPFAWRLVGLNLLMGIIISLGYVLFIVPGVLFTYWFALAPYLLIERDTTIGEALSGSRELVRGHGWEMFGLFGGLQVLSILEYVPFLGFIVAAVLAFSANTTYALRYRQLVELGDNPERPLVNPWNYAAAILGPIILASTLTIGFFNLKHDIDNLPKPSPSVTASPSVTPSKAPIATPPAAV